MMSKVAVWPELDLIRGVAVIMMVCNHFGYSLLRPELTANGFTSTLLFATSFAPVLFFFTTGLGYGISYDASQAHTRQSMGVVVKAMLLILADFFMRGANVFSLGVDFLAFIGFSMLLLEVLRRQKYAILAASIAIVILFSLRYLIAPIFKGSLSGSESGEVILMLFGMGSIANVSYWFAPWFIYPLTGFLLGVVVRRLELQISAKPIVATSILALSALITYGVCLYLSYRGLVFFRWGTLSFAYFVAGYSALTLTLLLAFTALKKPELKLVFNAVSMRGVSSFAAVPFHYSILMVLSSFYLTSLGTIEYLGVLLLGVPVVFYLSKKTDRICSQLKTNGLAKSYLYLIAGVLCLIALGQSFHLWGGAVGYLLCFIAQVLICYLLTIRFSFNERRQDSKGRIARATEAK